MSNRLNWLLEFVLFFLSLLMGALSLSVSRRYRWSRDIDQRNLRDAAAWQWTRVWWEWEGSPYLCRAPSLRKIWLLGWFIASLQRIGPVWSRFCCQGSCKCSPGQASRDILQFFFWTHLDKLLLAQGRATSSEMGQARRRGYSFVDIWRIPTCCKLTASNR